MAEAKPKIKIRGVARRMFSAHHNPLNDLHRAQVDAQARSEELTAVFEAAPAMTLIARDPKCRVITGGRVAYDLLRRPYGVNLSKSASSRERPSNFRVYMNGREVPPEELPMQRAAATGKDVRDSELTIVFANGDSRDFFGNAAPLLNRDGTVRGAVGVFVDITDRKRAERLTRDLYAQMLRLQDDERRRVARELHDSVGQNLTGLSLSLSALRKASIRFDPHSRKTVAEALILAREAARDTRTLSRLLHPPLLDEFGFADAIRTYVRDFSVRSNIRVEAHLPTKWKRLDKEVEMTLFRVLQEALTNVYRHSGSKRAKVHIQGAKGRVFLEVQDFGRGIQVSTAHKGKHRARTGLGIPGIQERLKLLNGTMSIRSNKRGTLLQASLPTSPPTGNNH